MNAPLRYLRAAERVSRPWKNGGGETADVVIVPAGAGLEDFDYRVSIATVAGEGPFSYFGGIDRSLAVVSGEGMMLTIDGANSFLVDRNSLVLEFQGETPVSARLVRGPVRDINVMSRRARVRHRLERLSFAAGEKRQFATERAVLILVAGKAEVKAGATLIHLGTEDAVAIDAPSVWQLVAGTAAVAFLAEIFVA